RLGHLYRKRVALAVVRLQRRAQLQLRLDHHPAAVFVVGRDRHDGGAVLRDVGERQRAQEEQGQGAHERVLYGFSGTTKGFRYSRVSSLSASASPTNFSFFGSK